MIKRFPPTLFNGKKETEEYLEEVGKRLDFELKTIEKTGLYLAIAQGQLESVR